jgi:AcrR family transcriptional regulator
MLGRMGTVKSRREQYAEQTRHALLDAAAAAFAERGFTATSIDDIAASAQVTKGAVYHHFSDKRALFEAVLNRCDEAAKVQVFAAVSDHPGDLWAGMLAALEVTLTVCADPTVGRLIYVEGPIALGWTRWRQCEDQYTFTNVRLLLTSAIDAGFFPRDLAVDPMAQLLSGMITHAGIALAEAAPSARTALRSGLSAEIARVLRGLRMQTSP